METSPPPNDLYRAIARINQRPIYVPNKLGVDNLKTLWGILWGLILFLVVATYHVTGKLRDLSDAIRDVTLLKTDVSSNKEYIGTLKQFNFVEWYNRQRIMWEQRERGESNQEVFYREHHYPPPAQPEK